MQTTITRTESIFQHHLQALANNDLDELMKDYTEDSEVWTPNGEMVGKEAISAFFSFAFTLFPKDKTKLELKKMTANDDKIFIIWSADSPVVSVPFATDCFELRDGKIIWQTTAFEMTQK